MREKTRPSVDAAAVTAAWDAFLTSTLPVSKESLNEQGWKDIEDLKALGIYWRAIEKAVKSEDLEEKRFRINSGKHSSNRNFYRPKV